MIEAPVIARATHRFSAAPERVFDAWLDPEKIGKWIFADEEIVHVQMDPRVGGDFSFKARRGSEEIDHIGTYREIDRPCRLTFSWGIVGDEGSDLVSVNFVRLDAGCEVTVTHELHPDWVEYQDRTAGAWAKMLASLDRFLDVA